METNDKHSDEWLDWLEDADTAGDVGRPADEKELERAVEILAAGIARYRKEVMGE